MSEGKEIAGRPLLEVGLIIVGRPDEIDRRAIVAARERMREYLNTVLPEFVWQIATVSREDVSASIRSEPSALLQDGSHLRDTEAWDFALMFTSADLISRYKPFALAVISSALDLAVISTNRIDPHTFDMAAPDGERLGRLTDSLYKLSLHALGHLNGLKQHPDSDNLMCRVSSPAALDAMQTLTQAQLSQMRENLHKIADLRLEERHESSRISRARFYLESGWLNRHEILDALSHARPWEFPMHLMRFSAAALSTMLILLMTAETWHLAVTQSQHRLWLTLGLTLLLTTAFVTHRHRLFVHRSSHGLSEQSVITNVSASLIVLSGMATMAGLMLLASFVVSVSLYSPALVAVWTSGAAPDAGLTQYLLVDLLVTTLGLLIGALGASFEEQHYFRHVVFVDEET
ncbi:hypothetical protein Q4485_06605 [Granulosicoccaceae sp. 1_MG-2023]|nr:hypothetical protein [Granulosicoccaceae sp. 1_MG-2023]